MLSFARTPAGRRSLLTVIEQDDEDADGGLRKRGESDRHESYESTVARAQRDEVAVG